MRAVALFRHSQFSKCERGSQTPERAGSCRSWNLSHADRLDLNAAFPETRSRSLNLYNVSKNVPDRNPYGLRLHANTRSPAKYAVVVGLPLRGVRVFEQFAWVEVGSVKVVLSRPAHQRVTLTVSLR